MRQTPIYDVCVIGSGAAGGVIAKELCEGGAKVIMLEAGREVPLGKFLSHKWPYELPYRGLRGEKQAPFYQGGVSTSIRYEDCDAVSVDRIRVLGGRTVHWNAVVLRYAERDFRGWSMDGIEEDWPLTYQQLAPYYERIEQMIGVCGQDDGLEIVPAGKHYLPPLPWRCSEHILHRATKSMGIPLISVRKAVLTTVYDSRPPCHYCGHCMSGCDVGALFNSAVAMLPKAQRTGNFTLRQNALAREVLVDREGLARGVSWAKSSSASRSFLSQAQRKVTMRCLPELRVEGAAPARAASASREGKRARQSPISASRAAARTVPARGRLWKMKPSGCRASCSRTWASSSAISASRARSTRTRPSVTAASAGAVAPVSPAGAASRWRSSPVGSARPQ